MTTTSAGDIRIQPDAFELAKRIDEGASRLLTRSVAHAQLRSGSTVLPIDVKAAMLDLLAELQVAFEAARAGKIEEVELSDEDFNRLRALPFRRPDIAEDSDDNL